MARKVQVQLLDDIDGSAADETIRFGLDGAEYEADLNAVNADALRRILAPYVLKARRIGRGGVVGGRGRRRDNDGPAVSPSRTDRARNQAVRDWAKKNNIEISDRGRIPANIVEQYEAEAGR